MPLPKTATIAARATEVYCEVWSVVLQKTCKMPPTRATDLGELSQLLPYLRQLLTCCACAGLLNNAMVSLTCGHCYCFECQFREPLLKIQCKQCRERTGLVMESQLQLLVRCYKHMCYILGGELRKNPLVLDAEETKQNVTSDNKLTNDIHDTQNDSSIETAKANIETSSLKKVADPNFDPVAEIVREVEKGTKVTRAILIIKPPLKYLSTKVALVSKKEQNTLSGSNHTPKPAQQAAKKRSKSICIASAITDLDKPRLSNSEKLSKMTSHKEDNVVDMTPKRRKTSRRSSFVPNRLIHRSRARVRKQKRVTNNSNKVSAETESVTPESAVTSGEEVEKVSMPLELLPQLPKVPPCVISRTEFKADEWEVCVDCLSKRYVDVTPDDTVVLLPQAQPAHLLFEAANNAAKSPDKSKAHAGKVTSSSGGQWRGTVRRREWGPLCPSVVVKRPREDIFKVVLMQSRVAKAKRKSRHKMQQKASQQSSTAETLTTPPTTSSPSHFDPPLTPTPPSSSSSSLPPPPFRTRPNPIMTHDLPIPDHIPILSSDGREDLLDADIDWTELSDFLESTDEEPMSTLQSFGRFTTTPQQPTSAPPHGHGHGHRIRHIPFGDFAHNHPIHPQFLPPPGPHHMPPRPPHLPLPHTPVMPYAPTLRADIPPHDSFFSPAMVPDDFIPVRTRIGLDRRGFTSPMTPVGGYSCPEPAYQPSPPGQQHLRGCFQIPNMGASFPPHGRHFPGPIVISKKSNKNVHMSGYVAKMKLNSPVRPKKLLPPEENNASTLPSQLSPTKKRRSPGYSEAGWRCRCGTNNVMFPEKVCAKGKCPCYTKGTACKNCLCRYCHNPFGAREQGANSTIDTISECSPPNTHTGV